MSLFELTMHGFPKLLFNNFSSGSVNIVEQSPRRSRGDYSTIFTEPEENNYCLSIMAQVIVRATVFFFVLLVSSLKTPTNLSTAILKFSALVL